MGKGTAVPVGIELPLPPPGPKGTEPWSFQGGNQVDEKLGNQRFAHQVAQRKDPDQTCPWDLKDNPRAKQPKSGVKQLRKAHDTCPWGANVTIPDEDSVAYAKAALRRNRRASKQRRPHALPEIAEKETPRLALLSEKKAKVKDPSGVCDSKLIGSFDSKESIDDYLSGKAWMAEMMKRNRQGEGIF